MPTYYVIGQLTLANGQLGSNLRVQLFRRTAGQVQHVGSPTTTNSKGGYSIPFEWQQTRISPRMRSPFENLFVRISSPNGKVLQEIQSEVTNTTDKRIIINAKVEYIPPKPIPKNYTVSGTISLDNGQLPYQFSVEAFDRDLRREELLGVVTVDKNGGYQIEYSSEQVLRAERGTADLFIRVHAANGKLVGTSEVAYNAPAQATLDLTIQTTEGEDLLPEYDALLAAVQPLIDDLRIEQLEEDAKLGDLSFLSGETGFSLDALRRLALGHRLWQESDIDPPFWYAILSSIDDLAAPSLDQSMNQVRRSLPQIRRADALRTYQQAIQDNVLGQHLADDFDQWWRIFESYTLKTQQELGESFTQQTIQALDLSPKSQGPTLSRLVLQNGGFTTEVRQLLEKDDDFSAEEVDKIDAFYSIGRVTKRQFDQVQRIQQVFNIQKPDQIQDLAKKSVRDWQKVTLIDLDGVDADPEQIKAVQEGSAVQLKQQFAHAFPTTSFVGDLERNIRGQEGLQYAKQIHRILTQNQQLELHKTPIQHYIAQSPELGKNTELQLEFKAVQRVFKLAPNYDAVQVLMQDRVHSAQQIYHMGRKGFVHRYGHRGGFTVESAQRTWHIAESTYAASVSLIAELKSVQLASNLSFIPLDVDFSDFPNWENLFKSGDRCACQHCQSVYSPAAYFADLLHFLKDRRAGETNARDLLLDRRPDLAHLELSCANANTPLPYIDVVNEVLEAAIAGTANDQDLGLNSISSTSLDAIRTALDNAGWITGDNAYITQVGSSSNWVWHSDAVVYLLTQKNGSYHARMLPNTKAPAAVLRARPQYTNPQAYETLREAQYPLSLPFDVYHSSSKAAFDGVKLQRWRLMELYKGNNAPNNPSDLAVAGTYLGLFSDDDANTVDALSLVIEADLADQASHWGVSTNAELLSWTRNVRRFLDNTGLEYNDLEQLLNLPFINPDGELFIQHPSDGSCDLDEKEIIGWDIAALDRVRRFMRLHRVLDWAAWELDLAIRHPQVGNGSLDGDGIEQLVQLERLRQQLGKGWTVERTLSVLGDLNTRTIFVALHQHRTPALYQRLFLDEALHSTIDPAFELAQVTATNPSAQLKDHLPAIQAALRIGAADLERYILLTKPDGSPYIADGLDGSVSLANLSFLYRQHQLAQHVGWTAAEWVLFASYYDQDLAWAAAADARTFVEQLQILDSSPLDAKEMAYLLAAKTDVSAAPMEAELTAFLTALRAALKATVAQYDASQYAFLQPGTEDSAEAEALLRTLLQQANRSEAEIDNLIAIFKNQTGNNGTLTTAEQEQIRFVQPIFREALAALPATVDFSTLEQALAAKIQYDAERQELVLTGFLSDTEKATLLGLSNEAAYTAAINDLDDQALNGSFPAWQVWLQPNDLTFVGDMADFYQANVVKAAREALAYWQEQAKRLLLNAQLSQHVGLPVALVQLLTQNYPPATTPSYYDYLLDAFVATNTPLVPADYGSAYEGLHWLHRVALLAEALALDSRLVNWLEQHAATTNTLSPYDLPANSNGTAASLLALVNTLELQALNAAFDDALWALMAGVIEGDYADANALAQDVAQVTDWTAQDVSDFINNTNLNYPVDFQQLPAWQRLDEALRMARLLHASVSTMLPFAKAALQASDIATLEQLLLSKYGEDTWLDLQKDIQDQLREQKRDALVDYLLSKEAPSDAPSEKWLNSNDLYAYYLLDVEMSACMQTSRLVQGSGSIQLFVQRALLGLEPNIYINTEGDEGDSGWHWWQWMRKYRVWEANRKVFLYPENWTEPELRRDRSPLFKQLEQALLQQEATDEHVQQAYIKYLEGLNDVANLEIATYFHEDKGDASILHLIGRNRGVEPHLYYYRRYDYRQWTAWEPVEAGITGDHLSAIVIEGLLYLYWPELREIPNDQANANIPLPNPGDANNDLPQTVKNTELSLSMSVYRNGVWTPKKTSTSTALSENYSGTPRYATLDFYAVDMRHAGGTVGLYIDGGFGNVPTTSNGSRKLFDDVFFNLFSNKGLPARQNNTLSYSDSVMVSATRLLNLSHQGSSEDLSFTHPMFLSPDIVGELQDYGKDISDLFQKILGENPDQLNLFEVYVGKHLSYFDKIVDSRRIAKIKERGILDAIDNVFVGKMLPFFHQTLSKSFLALPVVPRTDSRNAVQYYPDIKADTDDEIYAALALYRLVVKDPDEFILRYTPASQARARVGVYNLWQNIIREDRVSSVSIRDFEYMVRYRFPSWLKREVAMDTIMTIPRYHFLTNYHPFADEFAQQVYNPTEGIDALLSRTNQMRTNEEFDFENGFEPEREHVYGAKSSDPDGLLPREEVDFNPKGSYSLYNWELFYHAPMLIANSLSKNQRFEEAMHWYHYIFNPLGVEGLLPDDTLAEAPHKFWITKPFFVKNGAQYQKERIDSILNMLAGNTATDGYSDDLKTELEAQVKDWRQNPFDPHRVALYRTVAYQKNVFMKYLDNLMAWGDQLFRQDTMESINEAIQLYILAAELLGPKPRVVPAAAKPQTETYLELEADLDAFGNALVQVENYIPSLPPDLPSGRSTAPIPSLYFCIPENDKILGYWDVVADRLYKIRNCMNIDGIKRSLALFEPAIDPGALVKAAAGGLNIGAALADQNAPLPYHRFEVLLQKANTVCADARALGNALLAALEKKDAEELALLRHEHETTVQQDLIDISDFRIQELEAQLEALKKGKEIHKLNHKFYEKKVKDGKNGWEITATTLKGTAVAIYTAVKVLEIIASTTSLLPDFYLGFAGFGGSPKADAKTGGDSISKSIGKIAKATKMGGDIFAKNAEMADKMGYYKRREEKWEHQRDLAEAEVTRAEAQIKSIEQSIERAKKELALQETRHEQAVAIGDYMTDKYTNQELYQWMVGELSRLYLERYQLAYDLAKKAERCYRFELGVQDSSYIQFGHWNSLKKGLLSGEKLQHNLRRLECAYLEDDRRELELTKHCSLLQLDADALMDLRQTGRCAFQLPEQIFDLDYPGHYFRRIKSVRISLPCVAGTYTTISCTLTMTANHIRTQTTVGGSYARDAEAGDTRFVQSNIPTSSMATSHAQKDGGLFELSFNDPRYLPFEGAGVISDWTLELFYDDRADDRGKALRQFDYETISDAIIHVQYTARQAGGALKNAAIDHLKSHYATQADGADAPKALLLHLNQDFASEWFQLLHPTDPNQGNRFSITLGHHLFPFLDQGKTLTIKKAHALVHTTGAVPSIQYLPPVGADNDTATSFAPITGAPQWHESSKALNLALDPSAAAPTLSFRLTEGVVSAEAISSMLLVLEYHWAE